MIDPKRISPYFTKNSPKDDILVNFRTVAIHPTLRRFTPLYGTVLATPTFFITLLDKLIPTVASF